MLLFVISDFIAPLPKEQWASFRRSAALSHFRCDVGRRQLLFRTDPERDSEQCFICSTSLMIQFVSSGRRDFYSRSGQSDRAKYSGITWRAELNHQTPQVFHEDDGEPSPTES
jgi:hypothetical protein